MRRVLTAVAALAGVLALSAVVWTYSMTQSVAALEQRGQSDLALASDRLVSHLLRFRQLATWLASDPRMKPGAATPEALSLVLRRAADASGALDFVLLDHAHRPIASASGRDPGEWTDRPFIARAFSGALGRDIATSQAFGRRTFAYAAPVFGTDGPVARALVVMIDLEAIEAEFRGAHPAVFMSDATGVVYFSNRSEFVLLVHGPGGGGLVLAGGAGIDYAATTRFGVEVWEGAAGRYLPRRALHIARPLPVIGMTAEALVDLQPAYDEALLQAAVAGMIGLLFLGAIVLGTTRRRVLARANARLEGRVSARTRELSAVNATLRAEVAERQEAERALKRAQADLVQAEKLSALGKMTAGISHELNQPLMAIQSFADNGVAFLERGDAATAERNLRKISDLARRMARIIKNFRAFARQEKDTVHRVDLVQAVEAAVDLCAARLQQQDVTLDLALPATPVWVQGGEVRLQQVALNLMSNAIDAMAASDRRRLTVSVTAGAPVVLTVRDTGPGIEAPEKVFEPFYTTKAIGETDGVGLGLSISYGLVQSFGGSIRGANAPGGGAVFTVELNPWADEMAA